MMRSLSIVLLLLALGCQDRSAITEEATTEEHADEAHADNAPHADEADHEAHAEAAEGTEPAGEGPTSYGEPLSETEATPLATIAGDPETFAGKTVKTEGEIAAVCQRMGCWMEMRAEGVDPIRVPMAGHSFFLPKDVSGRHATVEGQVNVRELSDDEREHLESEGALATAQALEIAATGVVIR